MKEQWYQEISHNLDFSLPGGLLACLLSVDSCTDTELKNCRNINHIIVSVVFEIEKHLCDAT